MNNRSIIKAATVVAASIFCAGCANRLVKKSPPLDSSSQTAAPTEVSDAEPSLRGDEMHAIPQLTAVHFDFNSDFLKPEALKVLAANAQWLKDHGDIRTQVAGNCDQRGTVEYNLALGQRRAAAVRDYYLHMGVAGNRVATISYGKEKTVCQQSNEACWFKNRRAETLAASPMVANSR